MTVIGWDISTAAIGVAVSRHGHPMEEFYVIMPRGVTHLQKWNDAIVKIIKLLNRILNEGSGKVTHVVEERLGGFTGGMTTKQTLMALAAMNAVVSHHLSQSGDVMYIAPVTTKRIMNLKDFTLEGEDKKETVVRLARSACPSFPYEEKAKPKKPPKNKVYPWVVGVDDMADAWLLAEAGLRVLRGEASIGRPEKTGGGKGKARRTKERRPKEG
jgi:hypothetical protein